MEIREATSHDAGAVHRVAEASWRAAHTHILGTETVEQLLDKWYNREHLEERISYEYKPMFLAVDDGDIVGFAQGVPGESGDPGEAIVGSLYVHPEHWNEGIGTALLHRLFDAFRDRGHTSVCLAVLADNEIGRSFYDRHGFEVHEERTVELAGQQVEDLVLLRELSSEDLANDS